MLRIGVTGGTGAGKSTVAARLATLGAVVVDADRLAREVVTPGSEGLAAVVREFGPTVRRTDGSLDRAALAALTFADDGRRRALEALTHPRIAALTTELFAAAPADAIVVHDVPLLVEKGMWPAYHLVLVVDAPEAVRVARLVSSRRMAPDDVRARIRSQATTAQRRAAADVWLDTDRPAGDVEADVERLWRERLVPFEHNVRTRTPVVRPDLPMLLPSCKSWPAAVARLAGRVAFAAGTLGRGVHHVRSTSVPGPAAEDVIDLQLAVDSPADADTLRRALEDAGFPRIEGSVEDGTDAVHSAMDADPVGWDERLHGGADPQVLVHLHVRVS